MELKPARTAMTNPRAHFYGDSFTAGQGDPESLGWVGRIAALAPEVDYVNHGVPGAPGEYVAQTFVRTQFDSARVELAVFCFGTNDAVLHHSVEQSLEALTGSLDLARERGIPAFVIGPPPIGDMPSEDLVLRSLSDAFAGVCAARDIPFIATFDLLGPGSVWRAEAEAGDGSHPGAGGYAEMAELLDEAGLTQWLKAARA